MSKPIREEALPCLDCEGLEIDIKKGKYVYVGVSRKNKKTGWIFGPCFGLFLCLFFLAGCGTQGLSKRTELAMGTVVEIVVLNHGNNPSRIQKAVDQAFDAIRRVEGLMSRYRPDSEISRLNEPGRANLIRLSPQTMEVIQRSLELSKETDGAFDITVLPLEEMWRFHTQSAGKIPSQVQIDDVLKLVGFNKVIIDEDEGKVDFSQPGMKVDLGGIAKGFAVDKAIQALKKGGINNAMVNAGGDIYCVGRGKDLRGWKIGIQHPRKRGHLLAALTVSDRAVATSGDYERYVEVEGKMYSHIIDPCNGWPVSEMPMSVTVLAPDCTTADGLATAIFVLGPERGLKLLERLDDIEGVIVTSEDGRPKTMVSEGLKGKLRFNRNL